VRYRAQDGSRIDDGRKEWAQVPASLFDNVRRDDVRPALFDEPTSSYLNRRSGASWQRVRDLLDEWFSRISDEKAAAELRSRLQSATAFTFRSAFFELYCHEAIRRSGWDLEHHPVLAHTTKRPDLRLTQGGITTAYVEVTTTAKERLDEASEARLDTVIDTINDRMQIDHFMLGMEVLNVGSDAPATRPLCDKLQEWLSSLDADQLIASGSPGADDEPESFEWDHGDWHLIFEAYPLAPDRRGPGGRIIGVIRPAEAHAIDDVKPLRKRLAAKAKAYGKLDAPYVIAIDAVGEFTEDNDFLSALYGTPAVRYYENPGPDAPPPTGIRRSDGLWTRPHGWHNTHVSAVLASTRLMPWTVGSAVPTLWHHPAAALPVDGICPLLRQARPDLTSRQIQYSEPEVTPHEFFELPEGWPTL
jgi:hypothetical protein